MYALRRFVIVFLILLIAWVGVGALHRHLDPNKTKSEEEREDAKWIASSQYFLDRFACRYFSLCGLAHFRPDPAVRKWKKKKKNNLASEDLEGELDDLDGPFEDWEDVMSRRNLTPGELNGMGQIIKDVPQFVLDAAPLVHLYSGEQFWPSSMVDHLANTIPHENHTALPVEGMRYTLDNLADLHNLSPVSRSLFLQSKDDVEDRPTWLGSAHNVPVPHRDGSYDGEEEDDSDIVDPSTLYEDDGRSDPERPMWWDMDSESMPSSDPGRISNLQPEAHSPLKTDLRRRHIRRPAEQTPIQSPDPSGYSSAPAILVLIDKGHGVLDAFWFYFYSYNLGTTVFNMRFGNHVGDWEHSLIRFHNGKPKAVFFSAHSGGTAYTWDAVEKGKGGRPVLYSARGSHAMYAMPGRHPYVLPFGILADVTDKGPLWDPIKNYLGYSYKTTITHDIDAESAKTNSSLLSSILSGSPDDDFLSATVADQFEPLSSNPNAPTSWFWYRGHWGDKFYKLNDLRQWRFFGQYHYVNGPLGPIYKNLGRSKVCQSRGKCVLLDSLEKGKKASWIS
ncbi:hypothetical protein F5884DRAFT_307021 [Xylogone sp. PMI_703]|nr:hypothetical protein F5884DRAFT_307021 [Xylogone sp. PMI_703]